MKMVMCRACGNFVQALERNGELEPLRDDCPQCGGTEFKDNDTGAAIRTEVSESE